jgi:hypothetical protein
MIVEGPSEEVVVEEGSEVEVEEEEDVGTSCQTL